MTVVNYIMAVIIMIVITTEIITIKIYSGCCHCFHWLQNWKPLRKVLKIFIYKSVVQHQLTNPIKQIKIHFSPTHSP